MKYTKRFRKPYVTDEVIYRNDVDRLIGVANDNGYHLDIHDAVWAWEDYSNIYSAGWLNMDRYSDDDLLSILKNRLLTEHII